MTQTQSNLNKIIPNYDASGLKVATIVSRFNEPVTSALLEGALKEFDKLGLDPKNHDLMEVPGAFELPLTAKLLAESKKYDAILCLGAVIRGETTHYDIVCEESASGIAKVSYEFNMPVILGVLTTENKEQALERAMSDRKDKGGECARAAVEMANLTKVITT